MEIRLPQLAEGADSGTVVNLAVSVGDRLEKNQTILEMENEKAVAPIPSPAAGRVVKVHVKEGDTISAGRLLVTLSESGEEAEDPKRKPKAKRGKQAGQTGREKAKKGRQEEEETREAAQGASREETDEPGYRPAAGSGAPPPASPSVRKLAREMGLDLTRVRGSASGGRITPEDVRRHLQRLQEAAARKGGAQAAAGEPAAPAPEPMDFSRWGKVTRRPLTPTRRTIARRMQAAWETIPHVTQFDEADVTGLMALKKKHEDVYRNRQAPLTLTAFLFKALPPILKQYPVFNASLDEASNELVLKQYVHLGVAVDTDKGLLAPVIRDADKKSLVELCQALRETAERARDHRLPPDALKGSGFTVSNQGGIGGGHFTPIIKKPETAILGAGRAAERPVVRQGAVTLRVILPLALSYDHRVIDGADAARFITALVRALETFPESEVAL
ncbi:MAG: branched-chain alpha-keto acid dehydrogenase subunit E2 [Candidatus Omnitrophica bacterium CG11_big_fil_rev_8_21_14_0_20_64_10]|nr:MAG: branched-chain alpha-keto acid dehydrogenase subunit E2 [Candidatus Omnitrophica bacterium CG11_big_fil_rev_8_21_14_0_20_64_10]